MMSVMREYHLRRELQKRGEQIAKDISGDHPDIDTSFECYVFYHEQDSEHVTPIGFIYMGDCGSWAFRLDENDELDDAHDLNDWAQQQSPYKTHKSW